MQVWLRLLIVWFVAIALPVQGMAGVTMAHCGSSHERMGAAVEATQHRHADHDAGRTHHHAGAPAEGMDSADRAAAPHAQVKSDKMSDLGQYKCSSCASCCAGSALPSTMPRIPHAPAAPAVFAEDMVTVDAFAADGPDRPPRTYLV